MILFYIKKILNIYEILYILYPIFIEMEKQNIRKQKLKFNTPI